MATRSGSRPASYHLTDGQLTVATDVTIMGAGADRTTISGDRELRLVQVGGDLSTQPTVEIAHLTLTRGGSSCGLGGNVLNYGNLRLHHVAITDGVAASGGGVANLGRLTLDHSLISGNAAIGCDGTRLRRRRPQLRRDRRRARARRRDRDRQRRRHAAAASPSTTSPRASRARSGRGSSASRWRATARSRTPAAGCTSIRGRARG